MARGRHNDLLSSITHGRARALYLYIATGWCYLPCRFGLQKISPFAPIISFSQISCSISPCVNKNCRFLIHFHLQPQLLSPLPPQSLDSKQRHQIRASRLLNYINQGKEVEDNHRLADEFGLLTLAQDKTISIGLPMQLPPHTPHLCNLTSSQHKCTPSVPLASSMSPNSPPWNSDELELSSHPFPQPSASPPIPTFSLPLSHASSNPKSHSSQMHLVSGSHLLGKDKYFAKEQSERCRLCKKFRPVVVNNDDFLELEEGVVPRAPGVAYAGRGYLPNLSGSRSSINERKAFTVGIQLKRCIILPPTTSDIQPSAGGLLSAAVLLALEGRGSATESSTGSANVAAGVGPPMSGWSAFLKRIGSLKQWAGAGVGRKRGQD